MDAQRRGPRPRKPYKLVGALSGGLESGVRVASSCQLPVQRPGLVPAGRAPARIRLSSPRRIRMWRPLVQQAMHRWWATGPVGDSAEVRWCPEPGRTPWVGRDGRSPAEGAPDQPCRTKTSPPRTIRIPNSATCVTELRRAFLAPYPRTVATRDVRHIPGGTRLDEPATAYYHPDGGYVVINDRTGAVVQVSNRNKRLWRAPWD